MHPVESDCLCGRYVRGQFKGIVVFGQGSQLGKGGGGCTRLMLSWITKVPTIGHCEVRCFSSHTSNQCGLRHVNDVGCKCHKTETAEPQRISHHAPRASSEFERLCNDVEAEVNDT